MTPDALVVDASALILVVTDRTDAGELARQHLVDRVRHAPHLIDAETGNVLRRQVLQGALNSTQADRARRMAERTIHHRHQHHGSLAAQAWHLRHNLSFYDALYASLALTLGSPLLTADQRLAHGVTADIEVIVV